jgi:hypothetical protein
MSFRLELIDFFKSFQTIIGTLTYEACGRSIISFVGNTIDLTNIDGVISYAILNGKTIVMNFIPDNICYHYGQNMNDLDFSTCDLLSGFLSKAPSCGERLYNITDSLLKLEDVNDTSSGFIVGLTNHLESHDKSKGVIYFGDRCLILTDNRPPAVVVIQKLYYTKRDVSELIAYSKTREFIEKGEAISAAIDMGETPNASDMKDVTNLELFNLFPSYEYSTKTSQTSVFIINAFGRMLHTCSPKEIGVILAKLLYDSFIKRGSIPSTGIFKDEILNFADVVRNARQTDYQHEETFTFPIIIKFLTNVVPTEGIIKDELFKKLIKIIPKMAINFSGLTQNVEGTELFGIDIFSDANLREFLFTKQAAAVVLPINKPVVAPKPQKEKLTGEKRRDEKINRRYEGTGNSAADDFYARYDR